MEGVKPPDVMSSRQRHARIAQAGDARHAAPKADAASRLAVPEWARAMLGRGPTHSVHAWQQQQVHVHRGENACILSMRLPEARSLEPGALMQRVADAYAALLGVLAELSSQDQTPWQPWRFWNQVPGICEADEQGLHRYMHFNAGRFQGLTRHYLGINPVSQADDIARNLMDRLGSYIVAASAVDSHTRDLCIDLLAGKSPACAIENPRQVAAYQYSERYGPLPPCFARAVSVEHQNRKLLIVSGTASIVGEESTHQSQLHEQVMEIVANFQALVNQAKGGQHDAALPSQDIRHLHVYLPAMKHREEVTTLLREHVSRDATLSFCHADLCRPELLVEIEALASWPAVKRHKTGLPTISQGDAR